MSFGSARFCVLIRAGSGDSVFPVCKRAKATYYLESHGLRGSKHFTFIHPGFML